MRNIFTAPEDYSFDEALAELMLLGPESARVEFKEQFESNKPKIARAACSLANAFGGIVAIGFKDPERNAGRTELVETPYNTSEKTVASIVNSILSNTFPSVDCTCRRFEDASGDRGFYIVNVPQSPYAPHSFLVNNTFPVRRHNQTDNLSLVEIESLLRRRDGVHEQPAPYDHIEYFSLIRGQSSDYPNFFGITVSPERPLRSPHPIDGIEQKEILKYLDSDLELKAISKPYGVLFSDRLAKPMYDNLDLGKNMVHLKGRGSIRMRFEENNFHEYFQLLRLLGIATVFASRVWTRWGIGPRATVELYVDLHGNRKASSSGRLPTYHTEGFGVDFSSGSFADLFEQPVLECLRNGGEAGNRQEIRQDLDSVWADYCANSTALSDWARI